MNIPQPGSVIRVRVRNPLASGQIPPGDSHRLYHGQVLPSHKWLSPQEFCMSGDSTWPIRVINMSLVESLELESGKTKSVSDQPKTWIVQGSRGNQYTVTRSQQGLSCTCPGWQFRRSCRHITEAQAA